MYFSLLKKKKNECNKDTMFFLCVYFVTGIKASYLIKVIVNMCVVI